MARKSRISWGIRALVAALVLLVAAACGGPQPPEPPQPPAAPSNVRAEPGPGYVTVTWQDNSDNETSFEVYRTTGASSAVDHRPSPAGDVASQQVGTKIATPDADTTSYVDLDIELEQDYHYGVVAVNSAGSSGEAPAESSASVPVGVDLMVGTSNRRWSEDTNGTIFAVYFVFPDTMLADQADVFDISIEGPAAWNDDDPLDFSCPWNGCDRAMGFAIYSGNAFTAVAGEYTVSVAAGGDTYTATATLTDPGFKFPRPTDMSVSNASASGATLEWTAPPGARSNWITLYHDEYGAYVEAWGVGQEDTLTVEGLSLEDGIYGFEIAAFNADIITYPVKTEPFGLSYDYRMFTVGDVYSSECSSGEQVVNLPDDALEQAVRDELRISSGDITCSDLAALTGIDAPDAGITSLEGLQYAPNLEDIYLHGNEVTDVTPLADLTKIWHLNLNLNEVTDVTPLANLTAITELHLCCTTGNITDVTPLEGMVDMVGLNLSGHELGDEILWPLLENYPFLLRLWIGENGLTDFSALASFPDLEILQVSGNDIDDFTPIADLENLQELQLHWATIEDITPLYAMTQLTALNASGLGLSDISFLEDFVELNWLEITDNEITSLAPLVANTGLGEGDYVDVRFNQLDLDDAGVQADIQELIDRGVDLHY